MGLGGYQAPMRRLPVLAFCALLGQVATACVEAEITPQTAAEYRRVAQNAYDEALEAYLDRDWAVAAELMGEIVRDFAQTRFARLAELRLADISYHQGKFPEAIAAYRTFAHDHPNDPEVPFARFRIVVCQYSQSDPSFLSPPLEERDLQHAYDAYAGIRSFDEDYPGYERALELQFMLTSVTDLLVRHELYVARYYLKSDNFQAAVGRAQYALRTYPGSALEPEAIVLLGETYLKLHEDKLARASFQHVLRQYPDSAFTVPARRFLEYMGAQGK